MHRWSHSFAGCRVENCLRARVKVRKVSYMPKISNFNPFNGYNIHDINIFVEQLWKIGLQRRNLTRSRLAYLFTLSNLNLRRTERDSASKYIKYVYV